MLQLCKMHARYIWSPRLLNQGASGRGHVTTVAIFSRDLPSNTYHAADPSSTLPFVSVWSHSSMVVRRRVDVEFSNRLPAKGTTLSGLESAKASCEARQLVVLYH